MNDYPLECFSIHDGHIRLTQQAENTFTVIYGVEVKANLTYTEAATALGAAIMHDAACEYNLINTGDLT